jgi:DNA-binding MarR family transcriptional regulator
MDGMKCHAQLDSPQHKLIQKYIGIGRLHQQVMENELSFTGVYRSQHQLLMYVADNPEVSQKALAEMYGVSGATIAVSMKKLEKGGYIARAVDEKDGRLNHISITEKGKQVVDKSIHVFRHMEECMFEGLSANDMEVLGAYFEKIMCNLKTERDRLTEREDS